MGVISGYNTNDFISAEQIYSKIKREWKSLAAANMLDDGEFPVYTMEVLEELGSSTMRESEDILIVENGKTKLPLGFQQLHSAWKCDPCYSCTKKEKWVAQPEKNTVRYDITYETVLQQTDPAYEVSCCFNPDKILERITVQQFIKDECSTWDFKNPKLLRLSPNVKSMCAEGCINLMCTNDCEISINDGYIYTNFDDSCIYLKYYSYPMDENGYPLVKNEIHVRKAVEWWIKYQITLNYWFDNSVSDIMQRWSKAESEYEKYFADARYEMKLPSFATLMNSARNKRALGALTYFSQMR